MASVASKLRKNFSECVIDHKMIENGDHILLGLSGGKDSLALLRLLSNMRKKSPIRFEISAVTVDGGLLGLDASELDRQCKELGVPFYLEKTPIFQIVSEKKDPGSTFCSMCAKLRRGTLYSLADRYKASKIALGHHFDDALETLLMNLFFSGRSAALPPVLHSHSGHVPIIRPMLYCLEEDIITLSKEEQFKTVGCACPICPIHPEYDADSDLSRVKIKHWLKNLKKEIPNLHYSARSALKNIDTQRYMDPKHFLAPDPASVPLALPMQNA